MLTNSLGSTLLGQCQYPPGRGGGRRAAPFKDLRPPGPSGGRALCAHSIHRHQDASPAPAVVSSAGSGDHCVRSFLRIISREVFGGAKCRHAEPQCFSTVISRMWRPCSASILPPYAAPLLGRSLSVSQQSGQARQLAYSAPLQGKPTACSNLAAIPPGLASLRLRTPYAAIVHVRYATVSGGYGRFLASNLQSLPGSQDTAVPAVGAACVSHPSERP